METTKTDVESVTQELEGLRRDLLAREVERFELHRQIAALEADRSRLNQAVEEAGRRGADLASLYVAAHRLHSTLDRGQVLQALEEIVASLLGCEELAVFERVGAPAVLAPVFSVGVRTGGLDIVALGDGPIGRCAETGELWVAPGGAAGAEGLTACIPLKVDGATNGVLVLFQLLQHKGCLEPTDDEMLQLISSHAGTALLATRLRIRCPEAQ